MLNPDNIRKKEAILIGLLDCFDLTSMGTIVHIDLGRGGMDELGHVAPCEAAAKVALLFHLHCDIHHSLLLEEVRYHGDDLLLIGRGSDLDVQGTCDDL